MPTANIVRVAYPYGVANYAGDDLRLPNFFPADIPVLNEVIAGSAVTGIVADNHIVNVTNDTADYAVNVTNDTAATANVRTAATANIRTWKCPTWTFKCRCRCTLGTGKCRTINIVLINTLFAVVFLGGLGLVIYVAKTDSSVPNDDCSGSQYERSSESIALLTVGAILMSLGALFGIIFTTTVVGN